MCTSIPWEESHSLELHLYAEKIQSSFVLNCFLNIRNYEIMVVSCLFVYLHLLCIYILLIHSHFLSGDSRDWSDSLSPGAGAWLRPLATPATGIGGAGTHPPALHPQRGAHGEPNVCLPRQHGPAGHLLREQVCISH